MNKSEYAKSLFLKGYNCAQAVFLAFAEDFGFDPGMALKISSGFGGGMGRMREVCGTVSGAIFVLNLKYGYDDSADAEAKKKLYKIIQDYMREFQALQGSYLCRELLAGTGAAVGGAPESRNEKYYKKRPCADIVAFAAELLEKYL